MSPTRMPAERFGDGFEPGSVTTCFTVDAAVPCCCAASADGMAMRQSPTTVRIDPCICSARVKGAPNLARRDRTGHPDRAEPAGRASCAEGQRMARRRRSRSGVAWGCRRGDLDSGASGLVGGSGEHAQKRVAVRSASKLRTRLELRRQTAAPPLIPHVPLNPPTHDLADEFIARHLPSSDPQPGFRACQTSFLRDLLDANHDVLRRPLERPEVIDDRVDVASELVVRFLGPSEGVIGLDRS
jgi:hypothetical protein